MSEPILKEHVLDALKHVKGPNLNDDIVSLLLVAVSLAAVLVVVWRLDGARRRAATARRASADGERRERRHWPAKQGERLRSRH